MHLTPCQQAIMLLYDFLNTAAMGQPLKSDFDYLDIRLIDPRHASGIDPYMTRSSDTHQATLHEGLVLFG